MSWSAAGERHWNAQIQWRVAIRGNSYRMRQHTHLWQMLHALRHSEPTAPNEHRSATPRLKSPLPRPGTTPLHPIARRVTGPSSCSQITCARQAAAAPQGECYPF